MKHQLNTDCNATASGARFTDRNTDNTAFSNPKQSHSIPPVTLTLSISAAELLKITMNSSNFTDSDRIPSKSQNMCSKEQVFTS